MGRKRHTAATGLRRIGRIIRRIPSVWVVCGVALAPGCARDPQRFTTSSVDSVREVQRTDIDFRATPTTAERFGLSNTKRGADPHGSDPHGSSLGSAANSGAAGASNEPKFRWDTPPGWVEQPTTAMRAANFRPNGDADTECYLTLLAGDAGGLAGNVNRWRGQLGLSSVSAGDLEALPVTKFLGRDAHLVEFEGTWRGMDGKTSRTGWRLLGVLLVDPAGSAFLKMTGPDAIVRGERDHFLALAASFRDRDADDSDGPSAAGLSYRAPAGWERAPDRPSRAFGFYVDATKDDVQCYVTRLAGDAGGALANVNRWRGQIGIEPTDAADLAQAASVQVAGRDAILVECEGPKGTLLGAVACDAEGSIFVKLVGPKDRVAAQRSAFLAFCESLKD